jgi:hypothetical protein
MAKVTSSNIEEITHIEPDTLQVMFKGGAVYHYHNVDKAKYDALMAAESHGKHLNEHIKPNHKFTKKEKNEDT